MLLSTAVIRNNKEVLLVSDMVTDKIPTCVED